MSETDTRGRVKTQAQSSSSTGNLLFAAALVLFAASSFYAFGPQQEPSSMLMMAFDGPVYDSVEELAEGATEIVEVRVRGIEETLVDFGDEAPITEDPVDGEVLTPSGIPIALYEVQVMDVVAGDLRRGQRILVPLLDLTVVDSEHTVDLRANERYLLYLNANGEAAQRDFGRGGLEVYLPLSFNNGVLELDSDGSVRFNRWVLGVSETEAENSAAELEELELAEGLAAVEAELDRRSQVAQDRLEVLEITRSSHDRPSR